jgi:glyoxylase-like metal-dependent hydrolase (beta-lactamase superfamily II)
MNYDVQVLKMGQCQVPGPEVYWMSHWDTWETLYFWMVVIRGGGKNVIINTGPPKDLTALNAVWKEAIDERSQMVRQEEERPDKALARIGLKPEDINYVLLTPLQAYATGNIPLFTSTRRSIPCTYPESCAFPTRSSSTWRSKHRANSAFSLMRRKSSLGFVLSGRAFITAHRWPM